MAETPSSFLVSDCLELSPAQVQALRPLFDRREGSFFLVANIFANGGTGNGWAMRVSAVPEERRLATRAAITGTLNLPRPRKTKKPQ